MEKPFGTDLESAVSLNAKLHEVFQESQIFRIDHFLGKEPAQNILAFRFANGLFEPIWNRNFIDHIQIDAGMPGLDRRAAFYETTGAYRDMVVTHLFQIFVHRWSRRPRWSRRRSPRRRTRCSAACCRSNLATWCARNTAVIAGKPVSIPNRNGNVQRAEAFDRQLALGRRSVLSGHR